MDFFSTIIKNTATKVETLTKSATDAVNSLKTTSPTTEGAPGEPIDASNENGQLTVESDPKFARSVSGETEGADDDEQIQKSQQEAEDAESKLAAFNAAEISHKAAESAKYFGNFMYSLGNKAAATVTATATKIKSTVESVGIIGDFTKEQQDFIKEHGGKTDMSEPPWIGCGDDEEKVKTEILGLSQDKRNFVRNPPGGVEFPFDMESSYPVALALLREDPELAKMRYEIVPKLVNEETFWRNYFYRVSLIKQDPNFTTANTGASLSSRSSSVSEGPDEDTGAGEFVSDSFQSNIAGGEEGRRDLYKLGITKTDTELDEELAKDLQEFEVVDGATKDIDEDEINRELTNFDMK